ncbi:glycerophosphocholine phosphodiesterase GPCPD1 [Eupeodes corollae]|uniref:glycerophosphocholine phosphodiesterase GPCPD1 n=1 Tax=Eupeodes corollae TaxID=290404 RepID=UPI00249114A2|nr:glycerophosphocholine phosphodiesterase GPCPD1 [Eupeodes corollae]XP_055916526.1 glycerophosphocholine phosphodiesterase GPCPD1 [Eupeodes corollae]
MAARNSNNIYVQKTFNVVVTIEISNIEKVAITGGCEELGNWIPKYAVLLDQVEGTNSWKKTIGFQQGRIFEYRYFICATNSVSDEVIIRKWETHLQARNVNFGEEATIFNDIFGYVNGVEKIDRGWLTFETLIQFNFFNAPFEWKRSIKKRLIYVKVTSTNLSIYGDNHHNFSVTSLEDTISNDARENYADAHTFGFSEVTKLKYNQSVIQCQNQFGISCGDEDLVIFHMSVADPKTTAYLVDLYGFRSKASEDEPPTHIGYNYVLPNLLKGSEGSLEIPITCAVKHRPLGMMQIGYVIIKPFPSYNFDMRVSFQRHWNRKWTGLDVGHRGSGNSFKSKDSAIRENTITSLKNAAAHGADMVEFDVQLSKDLVPVIYHDFMVFVSLKSKICVQDDEYLEIPMRELSLEQLNTLKVYHVEEGRSRKERYFDNDELQEHQPFPQLSDALNEIDPNVGFNIEIKWSQKLDDGKMEQELEHVLDKNLYVDCILDVVLHKAGGRRIVFSCFDPDICAMIRFKQNLYPVMFLTIGVTTKYRKFLDPRGNTIESAVCNSLAMEFLGIVANTEDLLRDPSQINLAKDRGLVVFCWGEDNNSKETIQLLKNMGLHAIIYDKMDILSTKENKQSVFLAQAKENQN